MTSPTSDAPPPVFSGTELILAALHHMNPGPLACAPGSQPARGSTDSDTASDRGKTECYTWGTALCDPEGLLRLGAVSKEL
jgi:hypothetical protein